MGDISLQDMPNGSTRVGIWREGTKRSVLIVAYYATNMAKKAKKHVKKQRKVIITDWMVDDESPEAALERWASVKQSQMRYAAYQLEAGEGGRPHIQAFIHWQRPVAMSTIKSRIGCSKIHCEWVISDDAAAEYCAKEEGRIRGPFIIGEKPDYAQKTVNPTEELANMVQRGLTNAQIAEEAPWAILRHSRGIAELRFATMEAKASQWRTVEVILLTGDAGTGKTAYAIAQSEKDGGYFKPDLSKKDIWFNGYQGQKNLILDDFRGKSTSFDNLLRLLDGHKLELPIKGGHTYALWERVWITSNQTPEEWYQRLNTSLPSEWYDEETMKREQTAFWRRVDVHIEDIDTVHPYPQCLEYMGNLLEKEKGAITALDQFSDDDEDGGSLLAIW